MSEHECDSASIAPHLLLLRGQKWLAQGHGVCLDLQTIISHQSHQLWTLFLSMVLWQTLVCEVIISVLHLKALRGFSHRTLRTEPPSAPHILLSSPKCAVHSLGTHPLHFTYSLASPAFHCFPWYGVRGWPGCLMSLTDLGFSHQGTVPLLADESIQDKFVLSSWFQGCDRC